MSNIDASGDVAQGRWIEGFSQVVCRRPGGSDFIISACVETSSAERIAKAFNSKAEAGGGKAVVFHLRLPSFARNSDRQGQGLLGIDLSRFERVS